MYIQSVLYKIYYIPGMHYESSKCPPENVAHVIANDIHDFVVRVDMTTGVFS